MAGSWWADGEKVLGQLFCPHSSFYHNISNESEPEWKHESVHIADFDDYDYDYIIIIIIYADYNNE